MKFMTAGKQAMSFSMHVERQCNDTIFTRVFAAPRVLVFKAWTEPKLLMQWWGAPGIDCSESRVDLGPGGWYRLVMRTADGPAFPLNGIYHEIIAPERIFCSVNTREYPPVWQELLKQYCGHEASTELQWTISFSELNGKTTLAVRTHFATVADRDACMNIGMADDWMRSLKRLEKLVMKIFSEQTAYGIRPGSSVFCAPQ